MISHYTYAARDPDGHRITGKIIALNAEEALGALQEAGVYVISIEPAAFGTRSASRRVILPSHEKVLLLESWCRLIESGMSIHKVLDSLEKTVRRPSVRNALREIAALIDQGMTMSDAVGASGLLPLSWVNVMEAGEKRGDFMGPLKVLHKRSEQVKQTMQKVISALMMPCVLLTLVFVWLWLFVSVLAPTIGVCVVELTGIQSPWWTGLSRFSDLSFYLVFVPLLAVSVLVFAVVRGNRSDSLMGTVPAFTPTRFPLIGPLVQKIHRMVVCSELQLQLEAGIPILTALITLIRCVPRPSLRQDLVRVYQEIFSGTPVWRALGDFPLIPENQISLLAAGHLSGKLPEMLGVIASEAGLDLQTEAERLAIKMRTLAIFCSGIIVALLVAAFTVVITCAFDAASQVFVQAGPSV